MAFGTPSRSWVAPRDVSLIDLQSHRVYGPFDLPDYDTCAARLTDYLASPRAKMLRRSVHRETATYRPLPGNAAEQARLLFSRSGASGMAALVTELDARPISDYPMDITISDSYVGFRPRHVYFDGISGSRYIGDVLAVVTGTPVELKSSKPPARLPLVRAMFNAGLYRPSRMVESLSTMRKYQVNLEPGPLVDVRPPRQFRSEPVDARVARRYTDRLVGDGKRVSVTIGMSIAILTAVRKNLIDGREMSVGMSIDGRTRFAKARRDIDGNFAPSVGVGSLYGTDWTAALIDERLERLVSSATPLVSLLRGAVRDFRPPPFVKQRGPDSPYRLGHALTLSHLQPTPIYERLPWSSETERHLLCGGVMDQGFGLSVYTERAGNVISLSLADDSGLLDVDGFYSTIFAELGVDHVDTW